MEQRRDAYSIKSHLRVDTAGVTAVITVGKVDRIIGSLVISRLRLAFAKSFADKTENKLCL